MTLETRRDPDFVVPAGTPTLLLADIEQSTRGWEHDDERMADAVARHDAIVAELIGRHGGVRPEEQGEGDSFVAAFSLPSEAAACALAIQRAFVELPIKLRIALHTGEVRLRNERNYVGTTINRCARLRDIGHGGQVLLSQATAALVLDRLPDDTVLLDLGVHRLKDLQRPERVFQLGRGDFPPLRSVDALPNNLPVQLTSFVGRDEEMAAVDDLVANARLVTLTGPGGCGKTRLAVHVAANLLVRFPDGAWFVDLGRIGETALVGRAIADVLRLQDAADDVALRYLSAQRALLVLDNCEHLVDEVSRLVAAALKSCPDVVVVATSREPLGVQGESVYRVPPLACPHASASPEIAALSAFHAVQLFVDRASRARAGFALTDANASAVAEICRRLDGIPLAIELAASRARVLSPRQVADGLADRFRLLSAGSRTALPRQQTMAASIDWSHELLTEPERVLLRRLAVFASGFTMELAEQVCSFGAIEPQHVLDLLTALVDKSLVQADGADGRARFSLLETIREYAAARLAESGEAPETSRRHAATLTACVEDLVAVIEGAGQREACAWIEQEYDNIRAAFELGDPPIQRRLCVALSPYWLIRGRGRDGAGWIDRVPSDGDSDAPDVEARFQLALAIVSMFFDVPRSRDAARLAEERARAAGDERTAVRASIVRAVVEEILEDALRTLDLAVESTRATADAYALTLALYVRASRAWFVRDTQRVLADLREAVEIARARGDVYSTRLALGGLAGQECKEGNFLKARDMLEELVALERDELGAATLVPTLADALRITGDLERARALLEEELPRIRALGSPMHVLSQLGLVARDEFDLESAVNLFESAAAENLGAVPSAQNMILVAETEARRGNLERARRIVDEAEPLLRDGLGQSSAFYVAGARAVIADASGDAAGAESLWHAVLETTVAGDLRWSAGEVLIHIASALAGQGEHREAARIWGAVRADHDATRGPFVSEWARRTMWRHLDASRGALGDEAFDAAWAEGTAMSLDEAIAYVRRGRGARRRPASGWASLTPTELEVTKLVATGLPNGKIGERLLMKPRTVATHLTAVFRKLGMSSRAELAAEAVRRGL